MAILSDTMIDQQLELLITCSTAKEMYDQLRSIHADQSECNKAALLQRFYQCQMEPKESVMSFVTKVKNIALQLKDMGEEKSDATLLAKVISCLPEKFG
uniref:Uncharacterized protein n=1 Tax=Trichogramma kaykai TaxID=54128 RepID=A0ABD2X8G5_9HYME